MEGESGVFYRIDPDLLSFHSMPDAVIHQVAALSNTLATRGTQLIFVPLPTKALVLPDFLGPDAQRFAYDVDLAATLFESQIVRLEASGINVVNARRALLANEGDELAIFKTDPRLTNQGLSVLVDAIASKVGNWSSSAPQDEASVRAEFMDVPSFAHLTLQMNCLSDLPEVTTARFGTDTHTEVMESDANPRVVYVGSGNTADPALDLETFLSSASGARTYVVNGSDNALAGLAAYLTSDVFRASQPDVLIWEVPIWESLAKGGDQPMREVLAAAQDRCEGELDVEPQSSGRLRVSLSDIAYSAQDTLYLDNSEVDAKRAVFHFVAPDGRTRSRAVERDDELAATGRFYMPLTGLWDNGVDYVDIDTAVSEVTARVALCRGEG